MGLPHGGAAPSIRTVTLYAEDLAYVHDADYSAHCLAATPAVLDAVADADHVVEIGCAGGRLVEALLAAGHRVTGVDVSAALIRLAKKRAPGAKYVVGSVLDVPLPACDAVVAVGEIFNYPQSASALDRIFAKVARALASGGRFVFDVSGPSRGRPDVRTVATVKDDFAIFAKVEEDVAARRIVRDITVFRRHGKAYRRSDELHPQRLYPAAEVAAKLRRHGFAVQVRRGYGDYRFTRNEAAFFARKR